MAVFNAIVSAIVPYQAATMMGMQQTPAPPPTPTPIAVAILTVPTISAVNLNPNGTPGQGQIQVPINTQAELAQFAPGSSITLTTS